MLETLELLNVYRRNLEILLRDKPLYIEKLEQTDELCLIAVQNNGLALQWIDDAHQTPEICFEAIKNYGPALEWVQKQTSQLCLIAVSNEHRSIKYVNEEFRDICYRYLKSDNDFLNALD